MIRFFASCPSGFEAQLAEELEAIGAKEIKESRAGVKFAGNVESAFRVAMWSRVANRVLLPLIEGPCRSAEHVYDLARRVPWHEHIAAEHTIAVEVHATGSIFNDTRIIGLKVKDALVDTIRDNCGDRPDVSKQAPDFRIHVALKGPDLTLSLELSAGPLHERGYRKRLVEAPIKENLAAGILMKLGWPERARAGAELLDPMCGSGTFLVEAAFIAMDRAPGLQRENVTAQKWLCAEPGVWEKLRDEANARIKPLENKIRGYDQSMTAVRASRMNLASAGVQGPISVEPRALEDWPNHQLQGQGLMVTNPPYGVRLSDEVSVVGLFGQMGEFMRQRALGWHAGILTADAGLGKLLGIKAHKISKFHNGPIPCQLLQFDLQEDAFFNKSGETLAPPKGFPVLLDGNAKMFQNRLQKNLDRLRKKLDEKVTCYRIYDADMPEYNVAIDRYEDHLVIAEYAPPKTVDASKAERRWRDVLMVAPDVIGIPREQVSLKVRRRQSGNKQYERETERQETLVVREAGLQFELNLWDYLDTGLFLDHRLVRERIRSFAKGKRFLNLFAYTGSATVYAASGGAKSTITVDMSANYLAWAERNMALNGLLGSKHQYFSLDAYDWLDRAQGTYDLIFLDPPTFSNSKRMNRTLDIQRDFLGLLRRSIRLLDRGGILIFSTNRRKFKLEDELVAELGVRNEDITEETMPLDFAKRPSIHQCWQMTKL